MSETFVCDECNHTWPRDKFTLNELRMAVRVHLWREHAINGVAAEDRLPMTDEQIAWVRNSRRGRG